MALLREHYPRGGINAVLEHLPHRTRSAIYQHARELGLRSPTAPAVRESWPTSEAIDRAIQRAHQQPMQRGDVVSLAERVGRPVWWVSRRARDMGLTTPRFRELPWTPAERDVLRETLHLAPAAVQRALKRAGYRRTETAIAVQRKRMGLRSDTTGNTYSCAQAAHLLGMDPGTLLRDIHRGDVQAKPHPDYATRRDGAPAQYLITTNSLRAYIVAHPLRLDLRKLPAGHTPWFIDLIAGTAGQPRDERA